MRCRLCLGLDLDLDLDLEGGVGDHAVDESDDDEVPAKRVQNSKGNTRKCKTCVRKLNLIVQ